MREYSWAALGNVWVVTAPNERAHVLAAERFVAAVQITLADLAGEDLLLVPGEIRVEVEVSDRPVEPGSVFTAESERDRGTVGHRVILSRSGALAPEADQLEVTSAVLQAIVTQSLLGQPAFIAVMERTFERGLPHMLTCVRPYDDLVDVHKDSFYDGISGLSGVSSEPTGRGRQSPPPDCAGSFRNMHRPTTVPRPLMRSPHDTRKCCHRCG